jgi:heptosyltransferase-1
LLPWGNAEEKARAERLSLHQPHVTVLPKLSIKALAHLLSHAKFNIAVDTGLGHLAAALSVPTISLYGPTDPALIGAIGENQFHLKANTLFEITPKEVADKLGGMTE